LLLELPKPKTFRVGRLGALDFGSGIYAYVGSARGPGGLAARLRHHLRTAKRCHWHIDYLRLKAPLVAIWAGWGSAASCPSECQLAGRLGHEHHFYPPFKGFGSSDCTCHSHLFHWPLPAFDSPPLSEFRQAAIVHLDRVLAPLTRLLSPSHECQRC
jgi:Uri superfamily endonuclease